MKRGCNCNIEPSGYGIKGPRHDGTRRTERRLGALSPEYIKIDERRIEDLICFAEKYATLLVYYNRENRPDGNWQDFISTDISTVFARIVRTNYRLVEETFNRYLKILEEVPTAENYKPIFDIIFSLLFEFERLMNYPLHHTPFKEELQGEITARLRLELATLVGYYHTGTTLELVDKTRVVDSSEDGYRFSPAEDILQRGFSSVWMDTGEEEGVESWQNYLERLKARASGLENTIYGEPTWCASRRIEYSLFFVKALFSRVYGAYIRLLTGARRHLVHSLENYPRHRAHNALLLAFFRLFSYAQEELNSLTRRHLEFYFKEVLRLRERPERPDSAHIVVELAKHVDQYILRAGTELKAGKDRTGKELIYTVEKDIVLNRAEVAGLKTLFVDTRRDRETGQKLLNLYTHTVTVPSETMWRPFGEPQRGLEQGTMQEGSVGFAITSPLLRLKEGKRTITIEFEPSEGKDKLGSLRQEHFRVELSGSEGWIEAEPMEGTVETDEVERKVKFSISTEDKLVFTITLSEGAEQVADYNPEKLDGGYDTKFPVVRFLLKENVPSSITTIRLSGAELEVTVEGVRGLVLQNDQGLVDPSAPFMPFGTQPVAGNSFYIGSQEIFSKPLKELTLSISWMGLPQEGFRQYYSDYGERLKIYTNSDFKTKVLCLKDGLWKDEDIKSVCYGSESRNVTCREGGVSTEVPLFVNAGYSDRPADTIVIRLSFKERFGEYPELEGFSSYRVGLKRGFIRLELSSPAGGFGHSVYPQVYTDWIVANGTATEPAPQPNRPYTPTIKELKCRYVACTRIETENHRFFHIHPFGYLLIEDVNNASLLPGFLSGLQGALFVGLKRVLPGQSVSVLFQLAEGTEDSSIDAQPPEWRYLATDGHWRELKDYILEDTTNNLLASGIIRFSIPEDASTEHTLMPRGMVWFRAGITRSYRAYPLVVDVVAQAGVVTFKNTGNDPDHLAVGLPAGSIKALLKSDSAIKKITQPYPSFGGRLREPAEDFYHRVSERLRHKNRAITVWDFERLVLEEFPFIYMVRCLPHTEKDNGLSPGAVKIVVVPDVRKQKGIDPFRPTVSNNNRERIRQFLKALCSGFVRLSVENPLYIPVKVKCGVVFKSGLDENYYTQKLKEDLKRLLAPWAFDGTDSIRFGGSVDQSTVVNYMEELPYVDHVIDVELCTTGEGALKSGEGLSEVRVSKPWAVLTTHTDHEVTPGCKH